MSIDLEPGHRGLPPPDDPPEPEPPIRGRGGSGGSGEGGEAPDAGRIAWLLVGGLAIAAGTALGFDSTALSAIVTPPPYIRAALVGLSVAIALVLLLGALSRLAGADDDLDRAGTGQTPRDIGAMIRGVRFVFLAVAALAAASGWLLGHPLPLVVALVIAGVDVLETSFLLIVVGLRGRR